MLQPFVWEFAYRYRYRLMLPLHVLEFNELVHPCQHGELGQEPGENNYSTATATIFNPSLIFRSLVF